MFGRSGAGRVLLILMAITALIGGAFTYARQRFYFPGPLIAPKNAVVPHGAFDQLGIALKDAGVIADPFEFRVAAMATRGEGPLHAGEFTFPLGASLRDVLTILRTAKPVQHHLTIPEGLTAAQIAVLLDHSDAATGETPMPAEGAALPQTYAYEFGATRASLLARATAAMDRALGQTWASRAADLPLSSSRDMLTLASIVERETSKADERPHVAAVFLNRIRLGMKLQADPTVAYAASGGTGVLAHPLTRADLDRVNPYNTYQVVGLPPGPIASPGTAAIQAVAHPTVSDDLYFVADGTGGHVFARSLEDHNRNVARWRALNAPVVPPPR